MSLDFANDEELLDRLSARPHDLVFLVGSAVTAPSRGEEPGVPRVDGIIELIRGEYSGANELRRFDEALSLEPDNKYQVAFRFLMRTRDQDVANAVIRRAVLMSRRPSSRFPTWPGTVLDDVQKTCRALEDDHQGWHLPDAVEALGRILAGIPAASRPVVLTSNFDPLIAISVRRAGGQAFTTSLQGDGSLAVDGQGCLVVHFHGDWFRTDTLHTPAQLGQNRPMLSASLTQLLSERTLLVLGYGGWDDVFTRSLLAAIHGGLAQIKVAWGFFSDDPSTIVHNSARLIEALRPGIERGRVALYRGIDVHRFLPQLANRLSELGVPQNGSGVSRPFVGVPAAATSLSKHRLITDAYANWRDPAASPLATHRDERLTIHLDEAPYRRKTPGDGGRDERAIMVDSKAYQNTQTLLDEIYAAYLQREFPPLSYGSKWVLEEIEGARRGRGHPQGINPKRILAPWAWLLENRPTDVFDLDRSYLSSRPSALGLVPGSIWRLRSNAEEEPAVSILHEHAFGLAVSNRSLFTEILMGRGKQPLPLYRAGYLELSPFDGFQTAAYRSRLVLLDTWSARPFARKILHETGKRFSRDDFMKANAPG